MNDKIKYFFPKLKNRLSAKKNRIIQCLPAGTIASIGTEKIPSKLVLIERLEYMLGSGCHDFSEFDQDTILEYANRTLLHEFNYLGSEWILNNPVKWNIDLKTMFEWPKGVYYLDQRSNTPSGSDIKYPWELSRCYHLLWLGEAFIITGDEKYADEVVFELNDWIENNSFMYTVNWTCAMEVAIRAANWMYALLFIKKSEHFSDEFASKVYSSLYQHGFFIYNNLERTIPYSNNHYYSDIIGLLYLGQLFKHTKTGMKWFKFALNQYYKETLIQILPSGVDYEKSVSYHRLMTELAVYPYYMLERVGVNVPENVRQRLIRMVQYIRLNAMPNGKAPMIADNDDGRFLPFVPRDFREHLYLTDENSLDNTIISSGVKPLPLSPFTLTSQLIQDSKIAILRRGDSYLFVNNADRWRLDKDKFGYNGTHIHNDLLSFVYAVGKHEIMVDPGGYVYTSDIERHKEFRSTAKHNTIMVDEEEQHLRNHPRAFMMKYNSTSRFLELYENQNYDVCTGEYSTIEGGLIHNRSFRLDNSSLIIIDKLKKTGKAHKASMSYHLAPGIEPVRDENTISFKVGNRQFSIEIKSSNIVDVSVKNDTVSPSYGVLQESKTIVVDFEFDETSELTTTINHT